MGRDATSIVNEFAVRPDLLRRAIAQHRTWIEQQLGVSLSEAVIFESDLDIAQIGVDLFLSVPPARRPASSVARRLRPLVLSATTPPDFPPLCELTKAPRTGNLLAFLAGKSSTQKSTLSWEDCPIALNIRRGKSEFTAIALNLAYHSGPGSDYETTAHLIVARRESASDVVRLIEDLDKRDNKPRLHVVGSSDRHIVGCKWDDLVLDYKVRTMLKRRLRIIFRASGLVPCEQAPVPSRLFAAWPARQRQCTCRSPRNGAILSDGLKPRTQSITAQFVYISIKTNWLGALGINKYPVSVR